MHLFDINAGGEQTLSVFATSYDEAAQIYMAYWLSHYDREMPDFEAKQRNPEWPGLDTQKLAEALAGRISGIGHFDPQNGWRIVSPTAGGELV